MHIVFVSSTYPPDNGWGGIGTYVFHIARGLVNLGHTVTVVCGFGSEPRETIEDGVQSLRLLDTRAGSLTTIREQVCNVIEHRIGITNLDIIEFPEFEAPGLHFQRKYPTFPVAIKLHTDSRKCFRGNLRGWRRVLGSVYTPRLVEKAARAERETVLRAQLVVSPSRWLLDEAVRLGWCNSAKASVVPNPMAHVGQPSILPDYDDAKVVCVGRLDLLKGADLIPGIAAEVWRAVPDAEFHFIGQSAPRQGPSWPDLIHSHFPDFRRRQLVFHGGVPAVEVPACLARFSLAYFASTIENFPYTQLECMWANIACVCASPGGAHEMGIDGVSLLRSPRTARSIAAKLTGLLQSPGRRRELGTAAGSHVRENFSSTKIAMEMQRLYALAIKTAAAR